MSSSTLDKCCEEYEKDLGVQQSCCSLQAITEAHKEANRAVFQKLLEFQRDIDTHGHLPPSECTSAAVKKHRKDKDAKYPEHMLVCSHRELQQVLPIPDIHQVSDCDTIYRFLIARKLSVDLALQDILHYIAFREKYRLNHIVWDEELDRMYNGGDGDELVEEVVGLMQDADTKAKKKGKAFKDSDIKVSRPLLQPGWSQWNCGVDVDGNLVLLQRPQPKQLSHLETKWPYVEGGYDGRRSDFDSGTAPCSNLLARLYLRAMEKGRRISALLNYNNREILRGLGGTVNTESVDRGVSNDRAVTCILDVGAVSLGHLTSSKYREAMHLFQTVSLLGQHYYPENMKRLIIVNGGFIFNVAFKIVKVWLDPDTQKKIVLLSETNKATIADVVSPTEPIMSPASDVSGCSGSTAFSPENPANYKLREALSSYIHPRWIPSFYGGANASTASPYSFPCGEEGTASSPLVSSPFYRRAGDLVAGATLPDMLPDDFVRHHSEVGTAVTPSEFAAYKTYLLNRA